MPSSLRYLRLIFLLPTRTLVQLSRPLSNRIWSKILPVEKRRRTSVLQEAAFATKGEEIERERGGRGGGRG